MIIRERVPLASLTTLRVGGDARFVAECVTPDDVQRAIKFAHEKHLPWRSFGSGSNVLASDEGYEGVLLLMRIPGIDKVNKGTAVYVIAGAGIDWDALVTYAAERGLWGLENLAGIPGTVGAAPVQNIGAYGAETKDTLVSVEVYDSETDTIRTIPNKECGFGYRESRFKHDPSLVILSVTFALSKDGVPSVSYKDLTHASERGIDLSTPVAIGNAVRTIRSHKFPDLAVHGTAGSFFKNPTIREEHFAQLKAKHPELPGFPNEHGVKLPLAFVLDHVLGLRGHAEGNVSLFEQQPLVVVAKHGATAREIDVFAKDIAHRVFDATSITVEREVQSLSM